MCVFGGWGDGAECVVCGNEEKSGLVHAFVRCWGVCVRGAISRYFHLM